MCHCSLKSVLIRDRVGVPFKAFFSDSARREEWPLCFEYQSKPIFGNYSIYDNDFHHLSLNIPIIQ